jgi:hypothetical protein
MMTLAGARCPVPSAGVGALVLLLVSTGCGYLPAAQERADAEEILRGLTDVSQATVACASMLLANDGLCAETAMKDGARLRFERVGFKSFGSFAVNVVVSEAGGLVPRIASCEAVSSPNFHREAPLGHHFHPTLIDLKEAVSRYREILEEVQFWPQCPQSWEVQDKRGRNYRYCARRKDAIDEPPLPTGCS